MSLIRNIPRRWLWAIVPLGLFCGLASGIGAFTFIYARGASYMTNDPAACVNCHVMRDQFNGWQHSSHRSVAVCNDCHTPHNFFGKYLTKGLNGYHHSLAFTTMRFQEPIRIKARNRAITQQACRRCHENVTRMIDHGVGGPLPAQPAPGAPRRSREAEQIDCLRCHRDVGHRH